MNVKGLGFLFSLAAILLSASVTEAQTSPTQGYPQIGPPTYSYSALYLDASQFCTNGFDFTAHGCKTGGSMWQAIASAIASPLNISGVIDARAFQGTQIVTSGVGTTALYGCLSGTCKVGGVTVFPGSEVDGVLLLGNVTNECDGPSAGYYTDGSSNGSNYGTPCVIVPWGFQIIGTASFPSSFVPCPNNTPPCSAAFPQRSFPISKIQLTGTGNTTMTLTVSGTTLTFSGGPLNSPVQNIYPALASPNPTYSGELACLIHES